MRPCAVLIYQARSQSYRELNQQRGQTFAPLGYRPMVRAGVESYTLTV